MGTGVGEVIVRRIQKDTQCVDVVHMQLHEQNTAHERIHWVGHCWVGMEGGLGKEGCHGHTVLSDVDARPHSVYQKLRRPLGFSGLFWRGICPHLLY